MTTYAQEFDRLFTAINIARPEKALPLLDELIALAEANGDPAAAEDATIRRMKTANELGDFETEFAAFEQLSRWHTAGRTNLRPVVLWHYKWIAEHLHEYPTLSRAKIADFFDRMEAYFKAEEEGLRPVYNNRMAEAAAAGLDVEFDAWRNRWEAAPADESDDCAACETHSIVESLLNLGRAEDALEAATPLLKGEQYCDEVPSTTFSRLLLPMLKMQNARMAEAAHRVSLRYVRRAPKMLRYLADHVVYLSLQRREDEARRLAALLMARIDESRNGLNRYRAAAALWLWASARKSAGHATVPVPKRVSWSPPGGLAKADDVIARYQTMATDIARQFDERNGTDLFAKRVGSVGKMAEFLSLPPPPPEMERA